MSPFKSELLRLSFAPPHPRPQHAHTASIATAKTASMRTRRAMGPGHERKASGEAQAFAVSRAACKNIDEEEEEDTQSEESQAGNVSARVKFGSSGN